MLRGDAAVSEAMGGMLRPSPRRGRVWIAAVARNVKAAAAAVGKQQRHSRAAYTLRILIPPFLPNTSCPERLWVEVEGPNHATQAPWLHNQTRDRQGLHQQRRRTWGGGEKVQRRAGGRFSLPALFFHSRRQSSSGRSAEKIPEVYVFRIPDAWPRLPENARLNHFEVGRNQWRNTKTSYCFPL